MPVDPTTPTARAVTKALDLRTTCEAIESEVRDRDIAFSIEGYEYAQTRLREMAPELNRLQTLHYASQINAKANDQ